MRKIKRPHRNSIFVLLLPLMLTSCAHSTIIPFQTDARAKVDSKNLSMGVVPTDANSLGIYRSVHPFDGFTEIGLITLRSSTPNLVKIETQLRKDAAASGADAIVDFKMTGESHWDTTMIQNCIPITSCGADGSCIQTSESCTMQPVDQIVSTYLAEGTLIKRKVKTK